MEFFSSTGQKHIPTSSWQQRTTYAGDHELWSYTVSTTCTQYDFSVCTYTLVELPVPAEGHAGLIPAIHPVNVVPLNLLDLVHSYIACKGDLQPHRQGEQPCKSIIAKVMALQLSLKILRRAFHGNGSPSNPLPSPLPHTSLPSSHLPPSLPHTSLTPPSLPPSLPPSHLPCSLHKDGGYSEVISQ